MTQQSELAAHRVISKPSWNFLYQYTQEVTSQEVLSYTKRVLTPAIICCSSYDFFIPLVNWVCGDDGVGICIIITYILASLQTAAITKYKHTIGKVILRAIQYLTSYIPDDFLYQLRACC